MNYECGKIGYPTKAAAITAVEKMARDRRKRRVAQRGVYFCPKCQVWHTTTLRDGASRNVNNLKRKSW